MKKILLSVMTIVFLSCLGQARGEGEKKSEKDIYAFSYLAGYKCYTTLAERKIMMRHRLTFAEAYKIGFGQALLISINESAFDSGFQEASSGLPSKYKEDILKE